MTNPIHLWLTSHCPSHFIIQFNATRPSKQRLKLSVSFSSSCPPKLTFPSPIDLERASWSVVVENDSLGEQDLSLWRHALSKSCYITVLQMLHCHTSGGGVSERVAAAVESFAGRILTASPLPPTSEFVDNISTMVSDIPLSYHFDDIPLLCWRYYFL